MLTNNDYDKCKNAFDLYVGNYDKTDEMINRKFKHSYEVSDLMEELSNRLSLNEEEIVLAKIIGLLHDIGRFEEAKKYHSFSGENIDHADDGCYYLFDQGHINDFISEHKYDKLIEHAIRYHNKLEIKKDNNDNLLFSKMIRDMDKVDLFKRLSIAHKYKFNSSEVTPKVIEDFRKGKSINRKEIKTDSDEVILILGFVFDFNYKESLEILLETGNFDLFINAIKVEREIFPFEEMKNKCIENIERKVGVKNVR